jgi:hypothetical protein
MSDAKLFSKQYPCRKLLTQRRKDAQSLQTFADGFWASLFGERNPWLTPLQVSLYSLASWPLGAFALNSD